MFKKLLFTSLLSGLLATSAFASVQENERIIFEGISQKFGKRIVYDNKNINIQGGTCHDYYLLRNFFSETLNKFNQDSNNTKDFKEQSNATLGKYIKILTNKMLKMNCSLSSGEVNALIDDDFISKLNNKLTKDIGKKVTIKVVSNPETWSLNIQNGTCSDYAWLRDWALNLKNQAEGVEEGFLVRKITKEIISLVDRKQNKECRTK